MRKEKNGPLSILKNSFGKGQRVCSWRRFSGGYLHSNILQSPTLNEFSAALRQSSGALSKQVQRLSSVPRSSTVAGSMSAFY
jgi:hypothetical protein